MLPISVTGINHPGCLGFSSCNDPLDYLFIGGALTASLFFGLFTLCRWECNVGSRNFDYCISDIRAMNTYNSYMLVGTMIFLGFAVEKTPAIPNTALFLLLLSFLSASIAIFFYPIQKPTGNGDSSAARILWLKTLIPTQWTVIFAVFGITYAVISRVFI